MLTRVSPGRRGSKNFDWDRVGYPPILNWISSVVFTSSKLKLVKQKKNAAKYFNNTRFYLHTHPVFLENIQIPTNSKNKTSFLYHLKLGKENKTKRFLDFLFYAALNIVVPHLYSLLFNINYKNCPTRTAFTKFSE